jgi:hypothetical protein
MRICKCRTRCDSASSSRTALRSPDAPLVVSKFWTLWCTRASGKDLFRECRYLFVVFASWPLHRRFVLSGRWLITSGGFLWHGEPDICRRRVRLNVFGDLFLCVIETAMDSHIANLAPKSFISHSTRLNAQLFRNLSFCQKHRCLQFVKGIFPWMIRFSRSVGDGHAVISNGPL